MATFDELIGTAVSAATHQRAAPFDDVNTGKAEVLARAHSCLSGGSNDRFNSWVRTGKNGWINHLRPDGMIAETP